MRLSQRFVVDDYYSAIFPHLSAVQVATEMWRENWKAQWLLYGSIAANMAVITTYLSVYMEEPQDLFFFYAWVPKNLQGWALWTICGAMEMYCLLSASLACLTAVIMWMNLWFSASPPSE